jgi:DNA invertase Pin-like site-specific DNA recombinase
MSDMKAKGRRKGVNSGSKNGRAKLNRAAVRQIRSSRAVGTQLKELALAYGVGLSTISRVCRGENWT